jgi:tetratricopeptide (TPR) repeat protein/Zn finger protein HypA/HybF involved in hydrogenase expression
MTPYANDQACVSCHANVYEKWSHSHHALAMQEANATTVLGDFNDTLFTNQGVTTRFYRSGGHFMVQTDGADNTLQDFEISHVFGVYPLQQYLVHFPDGRFQVLDIAWDSRPKEAGGQRWYHLHPDEKIRAENPLHWSGPNLNWNYMCAECHSTNLKKNYDHLSHTYATSYDAINVSCAACHGDSQAHIAWAQTEKGPYVGTDLGLKRQGKWLIGADGKPYLDGAIDRTEVTLCAQCHSRRMQLSDGFHPGEAFEAHHLLATLDAPLYFPDGQIKDEVYVYGSFVQSKMYEAGVTCSDCHDPHTLERKAVGDGVCFRCHSEQKFATPSHHHHPDSAKGGSCIGCHMPSRTYMGIDERNDHSFRIPRPDLTESLGVPNTCNQCHQDKSAAWATQQMYDWYGKVPAGHQQFSLAIHALQEQQQEGPKLLYEVVMSNAPAIAKATVIPYLGQFPSQQSYALVLQMLRSPQPQIRQAALQALEGYGSQHRLQPLLNALNDPATIVRNEAARQLSALPLGGLDTTTQQTLDTAIADYRETLMFTAERPESLVALGTLEMNQGQTQNAETLFKQALEQQPYYVPAYINYALLLQHTGRDDAGYDLLQNGLLLMDDQSALHQSLGLWYVRHKMMDKGLEQLKRAAVLSPDDAQSQYLYAVALASIDLPSAIVVLEDFTKQHSGHLPTLEALIYYHRQLGHEAEALSLEKKVQSMMVISND